MQQKISIARIIDSKIGRLSIELIDAAETHAVDVESHGMLLGVLSEISKNPELAEQGYVIDSLKVFMKSCKLSQTCWSWVQIYRRFPALWESLSKDRLIKNRIEHIEKICSISEIFSEENLRTMEGGIQAARQFLLMDLMKSKSESDLV